MSASPIVRTLGDEEVSSFIRQGWVRLEALIDPLAAADLLAAAKELLGEQGENSALDTMAPVVDIGARSERFAAVAFSPELAVNAARLLEFEGSMRLWADALPIAPPDRPPSAAAGRWYQDYAKTPIDRSAVGFWVALDRIEPDQGPLRFLTGSHRLGLLGSIDTQERFAQWESLARCPASEPLSLAPGDAVAHHSLVVHAGYANRSMRTLWSYSVKYFPAGARYTGLPSARTDSLGLEPMAVLEHAAFPIVG